MEDFNIRVDQMRETITFKKLGIARNVGVTGEAEFWDGMSYKIDIETPRGEGIHHEMGHFLIQVVPDDGSFDTNQGEARFPPIPSGDEFRGRIIRQASIPRANSFMTHGELRVGSVSRAIDKGISVFYNSKPNTVDSNLQNLIDTQFNQKQTEVFDLGGPDLTDPLLWQKRITVGQETGKDWEFVFRDNDFSQMASGQRLAAPVQIGKLFSDFWIGDRMSEQGKIQVFQYAQKVDIEFNDIQWPHVALNTLIKQ